MSFCKALMAWHRRDNHRVMPWKGLTDPYRVWLSEVILQQTRVEQGMPYYERFVSAYPALKDLAGAKDGDVMKLWEGLGYYSRCRNLLKTARKIQFELDGRFPDKYEDLLALPGVGHYTAAAIASFAFGLPYAVLDGNVYRVLARVFGISVPSDSAEGKKMFAEKAAASLDRGHPGEYNQAIMDFGATICRPQAPKCPECSLQSLCVAFKKSRVNELPVRLKAQQSRHRWFTWFVFSHGDTVLIRKRGPHDVWEGLYEYYTVETPAQPAWDAPSTAAWMQEHLEASGNLLEISPVLTQQLSHQKIHAIFIRVSLSTLPPALLGMERKTAAEASRLPFPGIIRSWNMGQQ